MSFNMAILSYYVAFMQEAIFKQNVISRINIGYHRIYSFSRMQHK